MLLLLWLLPLLQEAFISDRPQRGLQLDISPVGDRFTTPLWGLGGFLGLR